MMGCKASGGVPPDIDPRVQSLADAIAGRCPYRLTSADIRRLVRGFEEAAEEAGERIMRLARAERDDRIQREALLGHDLDRRGDLPSFTCNAETLAKVSCMRRVVRRIQAILQSSLGMVPPR